MDEYVEYDHEHEYDPFHNYDEADEDLTDTESLYDEHSYDGTGGITTEVWSQLRIGTNIVGVSSRGRVKEFGSLFNPATYGIPYPGSPYRFYRVGDKNYFVHDMVWWAFNGPIVDGYEVRHNSHYVGRRPHISYSNHLECLTCERITASRLRIETSPLPSR